MELMLVLVLSIVILVFGVFLLIYLLPKTIKVVRSYEESSNIVSNVVSEFRDRGDNQERRLGDLSVRFETFEAQLNRYLPLMPNTNNRMVVDNVSHQHPQGVSTLQSEQLFGADIRSQTSHKSQNTPRKMFNDGLNVTDRNVLTELRSGPLTPNQLQNIIGKSREHTTRLLKRLYDMGLVTRKETNRPFVYELS